MRAATCVPSDRADLEGALSNIIQPVRGMGDILPSEIAHWQRLETVAREVLAGYGYEEMRVPVVEQTELFKRSIGEFTDIVEKEMYTFTDNGGESLTLRPEATAGMVRAAISNGLTAQPAPARCGAWGRCSATSGRRKAATASSTRSTSRLSAIPGPDIDAELILIAARLWSELGIGPVRLEVNSLGTPESRRVYREQLVQYLRAHESALDEDSRRRLERQSAAHPRQQESGDARGDRRGAAASPITWMRSRARISTRCARSSTRAGIEYRDQPAAGAWARLLHAHRVRVDHGRARRAGRRVFRRSL